ncbi:sporulation protein YpjB [Bacillaceae bacterium W0354]
MLIHTIPLASAPTWNGFVVTIILVSSIIFTTLFYVGWKKYKKEHKESQDKKIDSKNEFD